MNGLYTRRLLASLVFFVSVFVGSLQAAGPINFEELENLDGKISTSYSQVQFNRRTGALRTSATITNESTESIRCPIVLVIKQISVAGVSLLDADGTSPDGDPYIDFTDAIGSGGVLLPGQSSDAIQLSFNNPSRKRFTFEESCFGATAFGIPAAPIVETVPSSTSANSINIVGTAAGASSVEISAPSGVVTQSVGSDGAFSVSLDLDKNKLNRIFVTAIAGGLRSAPTPVAIVQDGNPPALTIQFPSDGAEIYSDKTDVAGFIGDRLSGFEGLTVKVNGQDAEVDIGIGTNGTYFLPSLPLSLGQNTINVVATDALGNSATKSITVTRVAIPANTAMIQMVSGNGQRGEIETELPNPIVVKLTEQDGSPFANKVVVFKVTRSNGRLSENGSTDEDLIFQTTTSANGQAQANWKLGSDAGCGNNRILVTSKDILGTVVFCATATPGAPDQINIGNNNYLRAEAGSPLSEPLSAWVSDGCNGIPNVPVTFSVTAGNGTVNGQSSVTVNTGATGHANVNFILGSDAGENRVEANFNGNLGAAATFVSYGLVRDENKPTTFAGIVVDNGSNPIGGAECSITVNGQSVPSVFSGPDGRFELTNLPAGSADLHVDGLVANQVNGQSVPTGSFPALHFELVLVPNAENSLSGPIKLPPLDPVNAVDFDNTQDVELTVEGVDGLKMIVKAGSMTRPDGTVPSEGDPAILSLNQVHHDDVPMPMPDGAAPPFAWTLQPGGAIFDPPIQLQYPNMTGLPAGAASFFLSFDHDTGKFEIVAPGRVSDDGSTIVSDPGTGLAIAGWGCNCPPYEFTEDCKKCNVLVTGPEATCVDQTVTYTATAVGAGTITWKATGGGASPSSGTGTSFTTKFSTSSSATVVADLKCDDGLTDQHGVNVKVVSIVDVMVENAAKAGSDCYVTAKSTGDVKITLKLSPAVSASSLPPNTINWTGGAAGSNQLERLVSKGTAGNTNIMATCGSSTSMALHVHVVDAPTTPFVGPPQINHINGGFVSPGTNFGLTVVTIGQHGVTRPNYEIEPYLDGVEWRFRTTKIEHTYKLGVNGQGRTDISGPTDPDITPTTKAAIVADLTPPGAGATNGPPRTTYWSQSITQAHEEAHVTHFYTFNAFWPSHMNSFMQVVSNTKVMFKCSDPMTHTAAAAKTSQESTWNTEITNQHNMADQAEIGGSEAYAHGVSNPLYTALINAIP